MNDGINGPVCQCGETMDVYKGVNCCPHCEQACTVGGCPVCRRYGFYVNMRATNELAAERRAQGK